MRQLTSPPISARALASWLINDFRGRDKPLGSVALLLSEEDGTQEFTNPKTNEVHVVDVAAIAPVEEAIKMWAARGDRHVNNRLVFYFCGHGTSQGDDVALLMADYFDEEITPLAGAIDFDALWKALATVKASEQVFLIDACRANSDTLIEASGYAGKRPLSGGGRPAAYGSRYAPVYYSTLQGDKAYGVEHDMSLFTRSLLRSFRGAGSEDIDGEWRVNTTTMQRAIDFFMREFVDSGEFHFTQVPTTNHLVSFDLHHLDGLPVVPVYVSCAWPADNERAAFACKQGALEVDQRGLDKVDPRRPRAAWEVELVNGDYLFEATIDGGRLQRSDNRTISPPVKTVTLKEQP